MRTIEVKLYQFNELSEEAKEKAREWYRQGGLDYDWWDAVYEHTDEVAEILGIELDRKDRGRSPAIWFNLDYGGGAVLEGHYAYQKGAVKAIKEYASQDTVLHGIAKRLQDAQRRVFYRADARLYQTRGIESSTSVMVEMDGNCNDQTWEEVSDGIREALTDFAHWVYKRLSEEWDWLDSDEQVDETIIANEYEFTEEGNRA